MKTYVFEFNSDEREIEMSKLAIHGGEKAITEGTALFWEWPIVDAEDEKAILSVLDRGIGVWGTNAPETIAFQEAWAEYVGVSYCLLTNSGTSAMYMSLRGVGVGAGDEVLVPAYCYGAAPAAVFRQRAIPVFVDINPHTFTI